MRRTTSSADRPRRRRPPAARLRQIGWPRRAPSGMTSSSVPVTPRIDATCGCGRQLALGACSPASLREPARAATRPSSCEVSVASRSRGRDAELERVEVDRVEEAAARGVGHVRGLGVGVEVVLRAASASAAPRSMASTPSRDVRPVTRRARPPSGTGSRCRRWRAGHSRKPSMSSRLVHQRPSRSFQLVAIRSGPCGNMLRPGSRPASATGRGEA